MNDLSSNGKRFSAFQVFMMLLVAVVLTVVITVWFLLSDIFVTEFKPVKLKPEEEKVLAVKLDKLGISSEPHNNNKEQVIEREIYNEEGASSEVSLSEKELNAILAKNTDLANKLAIVLSDEMVSARLLILLDDELPFFGGKTLKVTAGIKLSYANNKPVVVVKGISVWGVPIPGAYLGNIKNMDVIEEFGDSGFWKRFADGVDNLRVDDGMIYIKLKQ